MPKDKSGKIIELGMKLKYDRNPDLKFTVVRGENDQGDEAYFADAGFMRVELNEQWSKDFTVVNSK